MTVPEDAAKILAALDPGTQSFTFQTFDDNAERAKAYKAEHDGEPDPKYTRILNGTLEEHAATLARLNKIGAGIFVTINATDLKGRKEANIIRVRAVFVDLDGAPLDPVLAWKQPHIVVDISTGKWHVYWLLYDLPLEDFRAVQKDLIKRFNADKSVHDLPRVMRLPGFVHRKGEPFTTRLVAINDHAPYAGEEFDRAPDDKPSGNGADTEFGRLNSAALQHLELWVPEIFGKAAHVVSGGYRISSKALGRDLQEDLSISPKGIKDFGVHDLGDAREGKRSPIDVVMEFGGKDFGTAAKWLRDKLGIFDEAPEPEWPQPLAEAAYHGLAGDFVRVIAPFSEADPAALLVSFMVATGNAIGRTTHYQVEDDLHHTNLFVVLVGQTSKARKGTSWGRIRRILKRVADDWTTNCIGSGLSSGEGIIHAVRDGNGEKDEGVKDKRLLLIESEFAGMLRIMARDGNSLSAVLRDCYDGRPLRIMNKNSPETATDPHISLLGHCTAEEIRRNLDDTSRANGFANRIIFICVDRSKELPFGADKDALDQALQPLEGRLAKLMEKGNAIDVFNPSVQPDRAVTWDREGSQLWKSVYSDLSRGKPGMSGAIVGRAEAHVVRLALLYAWLDGAQWVDGTRWIGKEHLEAALALWKYSEQSVGYIFGSSLGDPTADTILTALRQAGEKGMTRTEISNQFLRHASSAQLDRALALLLRSKLAASEPQPSAGGRPATLWKART